MSGFIDDLNSRIAHIRGQGLHRQLRTLETSQGGHMVCNGRQLINFSSNDYLGLAGHPAVKQAAIEAVERFGAGAGASRLICGSLRPHADLEETLARFKGAEASIAFSTGYAAAVGTIGAILEKEDILILDKRVHASIVDAARLCGAQLRVFKHNDLDNLEDLLRWADGRRQGAVAKRPRILVVTESIFSMDGDRAPLIGIVALKEKYGAWLMVDEAHACGLLGPHRRGLADHLNISDRIEIQMGTLGKAIGSSGGFICGAAPLIELLVNRARSFIFSTAPVPAAAAAAAAGIRLIQSPEGESLSRLLWQHVEYLSKKAACPGLASAGPDTASPILPLMVGSEEKAVTIAGALYESGFFVPAIRYPTVARGSARLRITLSAAHAQKDLDLFLAAINHSIPI